MEDKRSSDFFWSDSDEALITNSLNHQIELLNPGKIVIDRRDYWLNFGCDIFLVSAADLVLVDLRRKKGIGVGAELMFADQFEVPVIGILGDHSDYRKDKLTGVSGQDLTEWTHPFAFGLCDTLCLSVEDACNLINTFANKAQVKSLYSQKTRSAVDYFKRKYPHLKDLYEQD